MTEEGEAVIVYILRAVNGAEVHITNLGASVIAVKVPDANGRLADVALGYVDLPTMMRDTAYVGRTVGRTAGRIAGGEVEIGGVEYLLDINASPNHLNGGASGLHNKMWEGRFETNRVVMSYTSEDGEGGYPGNLSMEVVFDFDDDMSLEITYLAKSDRDTIINLGTNLFLNLSGDAGSQILDHELKINSEEMVELDEYQTPTPNLIPIQGTALDFADFHTIGERIKSDDNEMFYLRGYDHIFLKKDHKRGILSPVVELREPQSRRKVEILSSQEAVNVYSGNHLKAGSPVQTKSSERFVANEGVSIMPRAIHAEVLAAEELYCQKVVYKFSTY